MLVNVPQGNEWVGTVQLNYMFKVWFKCSRVGSNALVLEVKEVG